MLIWKLNGKVPKLYFNNYIRAMHGNTSSTGGCMTSYFLVLFAQNLEANIGLYY